MWPGEIESPVSRDCSSSSTGPPTSSIDLESRTKSRERISVIQETSSSSSHATSSAGS